MKPKRFEGYRILWTLMSTKEPFTIHEMANEIGVAPNCAYRHLKELWTMEFIHICAWERNYHHWMPVYKWGNKEDKPRPAPLTNAEKRARVKAREPVLRALKAIYMADYHRGTTWREALHDDA